MTAKRAKAGAPGREQEQARAPGQERGQAPERARGPGQARGQMTEQAPAPARGQTTEQAPAPAPEQARAAASDGLRPAYAQRLADFRRRLAALELDGFLVGREENLYYLSGFRGDSTWLLITAAECLLLTDSRYTLQATEQCPDWRIIEHKSGLPLALAAAAERYQVRRLGYDHGYFTVEAFQKLRDALADKATLTGAADPCVQSRRIKDEWELERMAQAAAIADEALTALLPLIRPGVSERELALELEYRMCRLGSEAPSFPTIAAAGERGALPHARPGDCRLRAGDMLTLDFGALVAGYHSDMTRTFILGRPTPSQAERYGLVLEAQRLALEAIRPGERFRRIDGIAREFLDGQGYGAYFGHGLGHSLGLEIHEDPRFSPQAEEATLAPGMVMTVEPGVYLPGWGGLRIEDTVAVTETGIRFLTNFPKTLADAVIIC